MIANIRIHAAAAACATLLASGNALCHGTSLAPAQAPSATVQESAPPLLEALGTYRMRISTAEPRAQRYFDQGKLLTWGFHFAAAQRSFREAARLDAGCAMCYWGMAYALGPSINHDPTPQQVDAARAAIEQAMALRASASPRERGLIEALARRYLPATLSSDARDAAYARAMAALARRHPRDADVLTLHADALMSPHGRDYWRRDGRPQPWTPPILDVLRRAIRAGPDHAGALHFHIHALEDSPHPGRALASAERLPALAPGVGHLLHMPAHVLFKLGRYAEAVEANRRAIEADAALLEAFGADAAYVAGYALHNHHYLWTASLLSGGLDTAAAAAATLARHAGSVPPDAPRTGALQHFAALPLLTQVRFGQWEEILRSPVPQPATEYTEGMHRFARAMAFARTSRPVEARVELEALREAERRVELAATELKNTNALSKLLAIALHLAEAEAAAAAGDGRRAIANAESAVALEDSLDPDEPPAWPLPARHSLGALLLEAGRHAEAQRVYRDDLRIHPANGWALAGLAQSLRRAGAVAAAARERERYERAWSRADVRIPGSRF